MSTAPTHTPEQSYGYVDESGELLFTVHRWPRKRFSQQPADGRTGAGAMRGVRLVPYRLPAVIAAATAGHGVYVVEGERDVHSAETAGVVATCNPGGALKWRKEFAEHFRGASTVVIVADRDDAGTEHARNVAASLGGIASCVTVQAAIGKDLSDHLAAGLTLDQLVPFQLPPPEPATASRRDIFDDDERPTRIDRSADPLQNIAPAVYVRLLTGAEVNSRGKCPCPLPGHDDNTPSFHAYDDPADGFYCYGCGAGGDLYSFARYLWGDADSFPALRRRLAAALIGGVRV